ncbi:MAG: hypothetical protein IKK73_04040 [Akkermansia sp.]|nr:hypothetical protein [Akkermansia sp.]MBR6576283.1 hypothetical protein [Akkermansia sp.]
MNDFSWVRANWIVFKRAYFRVMSLEPFFAAAGAGDEAGGDEFAHEITYGSLAGEKALSHIFIDSLWVFTDEIE